MSQRYGVDAETDRQAEQLFSRYLSNPASLEPAWLAFFKELSNADLKALQVAVMAHRSGARAALPSGSVSLQPPAAPPALPRVTQQTALIGGSSEASLAWRVSRMVEAWRSRGHRAASTDPLTSAAAPPSELLPGAFGLTESEMDREVATEIAGQSSSTPRKVLQFLRETYGGGIGYELMQVEQPEALAWLMEQVKGGLSQPTQRDRHWMLERLTAASEMENFLHKQFVGTKRFSLEGLDAAVPLLNLIINEAGDAGVQDVVMGMAHRGRLNVLINIMGKSASSLFRAFADQDSEHYIGRGDVKYHLGYTNAVTSPKGNKVALSLCFNPSHLEFVAPVVAGRTRSITDGRGAGAGLTALPISIHGDAAFIGQGIVIETLNLAGLEGYKTSGTIRLVLNNQVGFTTSPSDSRSTRYSTDAMKFLGAPVLHVNAEDLDAVWRAGRLAVAYRQKFQQDICIDLIGWRRHGHNEADEPRFTQPVMYQNIDARPSIRDKYAAELLASGQIDAASDAAIVSARRDALLQELEASRRPAAAAHHAESDLLGGPERQADAVTTAVPLDRLTWVANELSRTPEGVTLHPKAERLLQGRTKAMEPDEALDWGTVESLAYGTLVAEGRRVRLSGQDARRGTFTHRHAYFTDTQTGKRWSPYDRLTSYGGRFDAWDSPLSEAAVMGFEYGYAMEQSAALVIWEAQFGDFVNGAQVIVDQFISSGEDKWELLNGMVLLLPHGFEGQGPEHSYARLGRFLSLCAEDNIQVCDCTTPAQFFHLMRRQVLRRWKKPLVVMTPKSLLRHKSAVSTLRDLSSGSFQKVIGDAGTVAPAQARKLLLVSGRLYYDLAEERERRGAYDVHIVRIEQLYPLDGSVLAGVLSQYGSSTEVCWVQDEPWNMGAWYFIKARFHGLFGDGFKLGCISRAESASPATGSMGAHKTENQRLLAAAFG